MNMSDMGVISLSMSDIGWDCLQKKSVVEGWQISVGKSRMGVLRPPLSGKVEFPVMPPLIERFICVNSGDMVSLRHLQATRVQINQLAASTFSIATQLFKEHSRHLYFQVLCTCRALPVR